MACYVHVVRVYMKSRYGKHGIACFDYAFYPLGTVSLRCVFDEYRRRFGIESSYKADEPEQGEDIIQGPEEEAPLRSRELHPHQHVGLREVGVGERPRQGWAWKGGV